MVTILTIAAVGLIASALSGSLEAIIAVIIALGAPLAAYFAAARRFSGKIASSDASDLWAESRSIRQENLARITELNAHVAMLERRVTDLEAINSELTRTNVDLLREVRELNAKLKEANAALD